MEVTVNQLSQALRAAGYFYSTWNWAAMPLVEDPNGFPKRPFVDNWQNLRLPWRENLYILPWDKAVGLGLILGEASANLAVIDVDDEELAQEVMAYCADTRCVSTIRKRGHVYFIEEQASRSQVLKVQYHGRIVTIELKCGGTQVAAPPTIGYEHSSNSDRYPVGVPTIGQAWQQIANALNIVSAKQEQANRAAWKPVVGKDNRNNTMYREAHLLREAGMPLENALEILRIRWEENYESGDMAWRELENTIRSAYRKGTPYTPLEGGQNELELFRR
jgi:hypothetical protein